MLKRLRTVVRLAPLYIIIAVLLSIPIWQNQQRARRVAETAAQAHQLLESSESSPKPSTPIDVSGEPIRIILPNQFIDLPIVEGNYDPVAKTWPVNPRTANYATNTPIINNKTGVTVVYGHATNAIFGKTASLKPGDTVLVYTANNHVFEYSYTGDVTVNPTDLSVFSNLDGAPTLKLLTCSGAFSQNRRIMSFSLTRVV